jgi:hypothetical protein
MLSRNGWNTEAAARFEGSSSGSPEADSIAVCVAPAAKMKQVTAKAPPQVNRLRAICAFLLLEYPEVRAPLRRDHIEDLLFRAAPCISMAFVRRAPIQNDEVAPVGC